ncbi:MAG: FtsX-like permease family protein [Gammaproteobacteria bacterium]|nr:FtsX-like permease family protein [Gammaproteobacteria bacterium]
MIQARDVIAFGWNALKGYRTRTILMLIAMTIGVAAVLMLTALGEGARRYVRNEFASLGTNLVIILPGRSETAGVGLGTMIGATPRDLTLDDVQALTRNSQITRIAPMNVGTAEISWGGRKREVPVLGSTHELLQIRHWEMAQGSFLPKGDWNRPTAVCVIGANVRNQIFGPHAALGQWIRLGENRYRVIGIMGSEGRSIGVDVQDVVIIPVAAAQQLFNVSSLFRVLIEAKTRAAIPKVIKFTEDTIQARHQGEKDVTVITQDAVLATFDRILGTLTYAVGGIAAISLAVAGILIMNVMLIAVSQRTAEIGLLKALGASGRTIQILILVEALLLSLLGGVVGLVIGELGAWGIRAAFPQMQAYPPDWAIFASMIVAIVTGAVFSLLPARKAARLDPVLALSRR